MPRRTSFNLFNEGTGDDFFQMDLNSPTPMSASGNEFDLSLADETFLMSPQSGNAPFDFDYFSGDIQKDEIPSTLPLEEKISIDQIQTPIEPNTPIINIQHQQTANKGRMTRRSMGLKKEIVEPPLKRAKLDTDDHEDLGSYEGLRFLHIRNDGSIENLKWILKLKKVYVIQLPNMGNEYISRLIFDRTHKSVIGLNDKSEIVGGITYKPFPHLGYIEIAFVAVDASFQIRGSGRKLMNQVKKVCQNQKIYKFLTYADNQAVGFFQKCGFSTDILISPLKYKGYIKTYNGVTLMECNIAPGIDYVKLNEVIEKQKQNILNHMEQVAKQEKSPTIYSGLYYDKFGAGVYRDSRKTEKIQSYKDIPGMLTARGFKPPQLKQDLASMTSNFRQVLEAVRKDENAEIFLEPVQKEMLPDYDEFIIHKINSFPIDLQMIENRLNAGFYRNEKIFIADFCRMFENCRQYNRDNPPFPSYANICERIFFTNMVKVKLVDKEYLKKYEKRGKRTKKSKSS